jgi:hypothetical protein
MNNTVKLCLLWVVILGGVGVAYRFLYKPTSQPGTSTTNPDDPNSSSTKTEETPKKLIPPTVAVQVPFIFWGGDIAMFVANGGIDTAKGSQFDKLGLNMHLVPGDDFDAQVKAYKERKTPFLRGTLSMLGQKAAEINADPQSQAVVFLQLSWSAGDHMVARKECKTLADLKGKKIALQKGGPHVGMLDDVRWTAGINWNELQLEWTTDVTGDNGPAELFRKDPSIDACFVVSPDMTALTGGLDATGTGTEASGVKTVEGAHVLVSTAQMSRSIADVYACRKDYYESHREEIERFVAGYLKGCEELLGLKSRKDPAYDRVLAQSQQIFGAKQLPTPADADGLISDCSFVGLAGNRSFFTDEGNPSGFAFRQEFAVRLAEVFEKAQNPAPLLKPSPSLDYATVKRMGELTANPSDPPAPPPIDHKEGETIFSSKIKFDIDDGTVDAARYQEDFKRVIQQTSLFGRAGIFIRGHVDPTKVLLQLKKAGQERSFLRREGSPPEVKTFWKDQPFDWENTKRVVEIVESTDFGSLQDDPKITLRLCDNLSRERAEAVQQALLNYAKSQKLNLRADQTYPVGQGMREPIYPIPRNNSEMGENRRVEFRISKVTGSAETSEFFPY